MPDSSSAGASGAMSQLPPHTEWYEHARAVWPVALAIVFEAFAVTAVALRIWSLRLSRKQKLADHDWAILVALLFSTGLVVLLILATVMGGLGQHAALLSDPAVQLVNFGKIYVANSPVWGAAISAVKISILLLYIKIFAINRTFRIICWIILGLQSAWFVGVTLSGMLYCRPLAFAWNPTIPGGKCGNATQAYLSAHIINLLLDIAVALAPVPILAKLRLKKAKKIEITGIFALGIIICVITIARIILIKDLVPLDTTYTSSHIFFFTILEPLLGIILACLPVLRPAMSQITSVFTGTRKSLLNDTDYTNDSKPRTIGSTRKYSPIAGGLDRSDSLTRPINDTGSFNMDALEQPDKAHEGKIIHITSTWDVERR
ncbi:hypothetical protein P171DRAFT_434542 [Karstenula rhodostoma CBS 690.94]|uniref:Rhodopsin domain-containing protein n=1 Tax=Karstenula rhodostoma CBS 690.94 TaxID=1392251 RepID=A0A9P4PEZ7_9PLEO|nr:hypothetical protein P171DRAFT_434542 [Karstenula rhodostoma CBS 690.94]